ncbi:hypothetical protein BOTNAR_0650g00010 [Botryotinia narcissicola]|uniref:Uncharacterized protein n=1 Tax=Botryotinia narcissicola TaxID=278944 RepID=A0A4Z1HL17_9HELO|nr:hypothetical protein BOTNAR_0650g00010 [Botryotinia narcissicola]
MPELHKGGENKIAFKKWSVAHVSVLCTLIHSSKSAFAKNLKILAKAFELFVQELSNDLEIQALLKELDSQDLHPKGLEDSRYQHFSSDASDKLQVLFEEFPGLIILLEDLQKFAEGSWLSDTVVDAVMHLYHEKKPRDLYLLRSSNLELFNSKPKEIQKGLCKIVHYVKAFLDPKQLSRSISRCGIALHWTHADFGFPKMANGSPHVGTRPKTVKCSVQRMNSIRRLNFDDCGIIALNNAIAIYNGQADTEKFSRNGVVKKGTDLVP